MLLMAHTGITMGAAYVLEQTFKFHFKGNLEAGYNTINFKKNPTDVSSGDTACGKIIHVPPESYCAINKDSDVKVDYRFILLGSILPDLIDKPLGVIFSPDVFANGRIFTHTLLFLLLTILIGSFVFRMQKKLWGLCIAFGVLIHLLMDAMWLEPVALFWPFLGLSFDKYSEMGWSILVNMLYKSLLDPLVYVPEIMGCVILIFFTAKLVIEKKVKNFFLTGAL